jgi:hypothetical protein
VRGALSSLLDHPIDYAGLYPPAQHDLTTAVNEYLHHAEGDDAWLVDRFVCPVARLSDLAAEVRRLDADPIGVSLVGTPLDEEPGAKLRSDVELVKEAESTGLVEVEAWEAKAGPGAAAAVRRLESLLGRDVPVYLEFGWGEGLADAMADAASAWEEVGFKARTGGTTADAFPSSMDFAGFIAEAVSLEAPFKFTAGLHEPLRYFDADLGVHRFGFLNAMCAGALALAHDLNRREIAMVLELDEAESFRFFEDHAQVADWRLDIDDIEDFWGLFGGFGSCSVDEPVAGLRRLGLLEGARA